MIRIFTCKRLLYIFVLCHLNQLISSYIIIDTNDLPEPNFVQDVANDYELEDDNVDDFNIKGPRFQDNHEIMSENEEEEQRKIFKKDDHGNIINYRNKLLVKRIIPHGIAMSSIEYDRKFNTAYKPLVRVHKRKSINQFFNEMKPKKYDSFRNKDSNHEKSIFISPNRDESMKFKQKYDLNDKDQLQPFEISRNDFFHSKGNGLDFVTQIQKKLRNTKSAESYESSETKKNLDQINDERLQLVKQIQKKIKGIKSESKRLNAYAKVIDVLNKMLRSPQFEKSGEANDPLAPGKTVIPDDHVEETKPKKWMPHYPPWNYWTYKKTIHEDVCPGTQVKIGNMCIWTPPH